MQGERCSPSRTIRTLCRSVSTPVMGMRATCVLVTAGVSSGAMGYPQPMPVTAAPISSPRSGLLKETY
jgi:hypothetical protein